MVGGPGIFGYRWRLNGGPWSADSDIGNGFDPPAATLRAAVISLSGLADGSYTVEVEGRSFAGEWQETPDGVEDLDGGLIASRFRQDQRDSSSPAIPDMVEFFNPGLTGYDLGGCYLTDDPAEPAKMLLPAGTSVGAGEFLVVCARPGDFPTRCGR